MLAHKFVVLSMRTNPEPVHAASHGSAQRAMVKANTGAEIAPARYRFEVKRRVCGIRLEQFKVLARKRLNFFGQGVKALPEPR